MSAHGLVAKGVPPQPSWIIFLRIAILVLSVILLGLAAWSLSIYGGYGYYGYYGNGAGGFVIFVVCAIEATLGSSRARSGVGKADAISDHPQLHRL